MSGLLTQTTLRYRAHEEGINSWRYAYWNARPIVREWVSCGMEIAVQLAGEWAHQAYGDRVRVVSCAGVLRSGMSGAYRVSLSGASGEGRQVGYVMYGAALRALSPGFDLVFRRDAGENDAELGEFSRGLAEGGATADDGAVRRALVAYAHRHAEAVPLDAVARAKHELEDHFDCDLPISHLALVGGIHPVVLTRRFGQRYGVTPARYRLLLRLNQAVRLTWQRPDLTIDDIGRQVGFREPSYFHRAFRRFHKITPGQMRARMTAPTRSEAPSL